MNLYIEIENGIAKNHPAFEDNLIEAFGLIPNNWEPFTRIESPTPDVYQVLESQEAAYAKVGDVWSDIWSLRDMTVEEKTAKQQAVVAIFSEHEYASNWSAWTLDEATCTMQPPIPRLEPDLTKIEAGIYTFWCGADNNWKETPVRPKGQYKFNFITWAWVAL